MVFDFKFNYKGREITIWVYEVTGSVEVDDVEIGNWKEALKIK